MAMNSTTLDNLTPQVHFKRRKVAHTKRAPVDDSTPNLQPAVAAAAAAATPETQALSENDHATDGIPNLKEILRNRKRPRVRVREATRKVEAPTSTEPAPVNAPRPDLYANRFVAQTGQVVDCDDTQMSEYVEARLAEKNHRQYGWPIPAHLQAAVLAIAPDLQHIVTPASSAQGTSSRADAPVTMEHGNRSAAGKGKLEEVDLGPDAAARIKEAWRRLDSGLPAEEPVGNKGKGKYGFQWRKPKRRNSDAERREQMVEAVLKEAKLDYFDEIPPAAPLTNTTGNNDEAVAERFRAEYFEAMGNHRRRRAPAPASSKRGVKPPCRGPRLGGSKSARAKMHQLEKQAAKAKSS